jgi:hypothetical protein
MRTDYLTACLGQLAAGMLKLNRRVVNMEPIAEDAIHRLQNAIAFRGRHILDQRVTAQCVGA